MIEREPDVCREREENDVSDEHRGKRRLLQFRGFPAEVELFSNHFMQTSLSCIHNLAHDVRGNVAKMHGSPIMASMQTQGRLIYFLHGLCMGIKVQAY
jgi:hypothetical protein